MLIYFSSTEKILEMFPKIWSLVLMLVLLVSTSIVQGQPSVVGTVMKAGLGRTASVETERLTAQVTTQSYKYQHLVFIELK